MENEFSKEERIAFLKKKNEARKKASGLDWEKDKAMSFGNRLGFRYLSIEKMKRNLLPVFTGVGLDFKIDYQTIEQHGEVGNMTQHWTVECNITLTDVDTGYFETTKVFGESGDSGDKAIAKAGTYALKTWLADTFLLIDGVDPDADSSEANTTKTFVPKTDKEQEEVKSKVLAGGVKPATPVKEEKVAPTAPVTPVVPKAEPKKKLKDSGDPTEKPAAPAPEPKEMTPAETALENLKKEAAATFKPSVPQQNMINSILAKWSEKSKSGAVTKEQYEEFSKDLSNIINPKTAIEFIKKYRED